MILLKFKIKNLLIKIKMKLKMKINYKKTFSPRINKYIINNQKQKRYSKYITFNTK